MCHHTVALRYVCRRSEVRLLCDRFMKTHQEAALLEQCDFPEITFAGVTTIEVTPDNGWGCLPDTSFANTFSNLTVDTEHYTSFARFSRNLK